MPPFSGPARVCVNKWDINPENTRAIEEFARDEGSPVIGRIPFDPVTTRAMVAQKTVIEYTDGIVAGEIKKMWRTLELFLGDPLKGSRGASQEGESIHA
jgi:MinD superfamily P-loop ATPase